MAWTRIAFLGMLVAVCAPAQIAVEPIRHSSFADVARYLEADGDLFFYMNSDQLAEKALTMVEALGELINIDRPLPRHRRGRPAHREETRLLLKTLRQLVSETGLLEAKGFGMSSVQRDGMRSNRAVLYHGDSEPQGRIWQMGGGKPHAFPGVALMPENTVIAVTGDCQLGLLWDVVTSLAEMVGPDGRAALKELRKEIPDLDKTMAGFAGDFTFIVTMDSTPPKDNAELPQLSALLALSVHDDTLFGTVEQILTEHSEFTRPEIAAARALSLPDTWELPFRVQPTVAQSATHFILASNAAVVASALNVPADGGLANSAEFRELQKGLPAEGNQMGFFSRRLGEELARVAGDLAPAVPEPVPSFQAYGIVVRHADAVVAYSRQSANLPGAIQGSFWDFATVWSTHELARTKAQLVADNRPMSMDEILKPPPAETDNAALLLESAVKRLKDDGVLSDLAESASVILEGKESETWQRLAQQDGVVETLAALHKAAAKPRYFNDLNWEAGPGLMLPHLGDHRRIMSIMAAAAVSQALAGKLEQAWAEFANCLRLADQLAEEPILITQVVRIAELEICGKAMRLLVEAGPPSAEQATEIDALLARFGSVKPIIQAIDGERIAFGAWIYERGVQDPALGPDLFDQQGGAAAALVVFMKFSPLMKLDQASYLKALASYANNLERPLPKVDRNLQATTPPYCLLSRMFAPSLRPVGARALHMATQSRLARLSLAAIRQRAETGKAPESLDGLLTPQDRIDPFSGENFIYRPVNDGFEIRSAAKGEKHKNLRWRIK